MKPSTGEVSRMLLFVTCLATGTDALARAKTDCVVIANGDHITV
jgi:hypothetical protein